jgi:low temperature requirement protein LtrA
VGTRPAVAKLYGGETAAGADNHGVASEGKRVSWAELYFDLVFVFAVSQVVHGLVDDPRWRVLLASLGVFVTLWWTWIGFVLLFNRRGDDRRMLDRLVIMIGTVPCAIAATEAHHVFEGHRGGFILALAGARLVLVCGYVVAARQAELPYDHRAIVGYGLSALLFALVAAVDGPLAYVLWGYALAQEAGVVLLRRRRAGRERPNADRLAEQLRPPSDPTRAVDAGHLAERFGLFMIILLGEIVITVGRSALDQEERGMAYWLGLCGGLVLAGGLWWIYFTSAADINERLLTASGGNPLLANTLYAGGHLVPAFSLVVVAAGVSLSLHPDAPRAASWLVAGGIAAYLAGTRAFSAMARWGYTTGARIVVVAATAALGLLGNVVSPHLVVVAAACWVVLDAAIITLTRSTRARLADSTLSFLRRP